MGVALRLHEFCRTPLHPGPCKGWKKAKAAGLDTSIMHADLVSPRRPRKKKAAPAPAPPREAGEDLEEEARERQQEIDLSRGRAAVLAEFEEQALLNEETDPDVIRRALERVASRHGVQDEPAIRDLIEAAAWEPRDMNHAIRHAAAQYGLERIGGVQGRSWQTLPFNPKEHQSIDGRHKPKERVQLVRPGYYANISGERVLVEKALVETADTGPAAAPTGGDVDWTARLDSGVVSRRGLSNSDNYSKVDLVTFGDGSTAVHKTGKVWPGSRWPQSMVEEHDAEELAALVAEELGLRPPSVYRATPDDAYFDYIPDDKATLAMEKIGWGREVPSSYVDSLDGRRMGLLDTLTENRDRNDGNWFISNDDDQIIPIDHGLSWQASPGADAGTPEATGNPFVQHYIDTSAADWLPDGQAQWAENDLSPAYVASLRHRLQGLRPEFERLGRGRWHDRMMQRLDIVGQNASGGQFL